MVSAGVSPRASGEAKSPRASGAIPPSPATFSKISALARQPAGVSSAARCTSAFSCSEVRKYSCVISARVRPVMPTMPW